MDPASATNPIFPITPTSQSLNRTTKPPYKSVQVRLYLPMYLPHAIATYVAARHMIQATVNKLAWYDQAYIVNCTAIAQARRVRKVGSAEDSVSEIHLLFRFLFFGASSSDAATDASSFELASPSLPPALSSKSESSSSSESEASFLPCL